MAVLFGWVLTFLCIVPTVFGEQRSVTDASSLAFKNTLRLHIHGLKEVIGVLRIAVFIEKDGYPMDEDKIIRSYVIPVTSRAMEYKIELPDVDQVALSLHHDQNNDGKINSNFIGIPKEGLGASNNAKGRFGPPKFKDAAMNRESRQFQNIQINYIGRR